MSSIFDGLPVAIVEKVPLTLDDVLALIGDYGIDVWMAQIARGIAHHSELSSIHAMIIARLIELVEEELRNDGIQDKK